MEIRLDITDLAILLDPLVKIPKIVKGKIRDS